MINTGRYSFFVRSAVLPLAFRDAYPFGGGLHCATADVLRKGSCDDYFPDQTRYPDSLSVKREFS